MRTRARCILLGMVAAVGFAAFFVSGCTKRRTRTVTREVRCTSVNPSFGPSTGGTAVTIGGDGFQPGAIVRFGQGDASVLSVNADGNEITCLTPPGPSGLVDVVVWNPDGVGCRSVDGYLYVENNALDIQPTTLPNATIGPPYSQTLTATGGISPYTFELDSGVLPDGLILVGDTITGTPLLSAVNSGFMVRATDSSNPPLTGRRAYSLLVNVEITTLTLPDGQAGYPYSAPLTAIGGDGTTYLWSLAAGQLPCGLSLIPTPGEIRGRPCCEGAPSFTLQATSSLPTLTDLRDYSNSLRVTHWTSVGDEDEYSAYGFAIASAGDVNGDGYGDIVVGAGNFGSFSLETGKAYVYLGSPGGLSPTADWTTIGDGVDPPNFGHTVASAGDVNADGFDDVLVGAQSYDVGIYGVAGKAYLYLGGPAGPDSTPAWTSVGEPRDNASFSDGLSGAGDVNGDGYDDVIVGASGFQDVPVTASGVGKAFLFLGGPAGLTPDPVWTSTGDGTDGADFGRSPRSAGDVNGDGFGDVVIGASQFAAWIWGITPSSGKVFLYHGGPSGLAATAAWTSVGDGQDGAFFGESISSGGDVNGDGYDDIVVGAEYFDGAGTRSGKAYLYLGGLGGLDPAPAWTSVGDDEYRARFGLSVAMVGDVNDDGFADVIVGAPSSSVIATDGGKAFIFLGDSSGLSPTPAWTSLGDNQTSAFFGMTVASAGDVNGDSVSEVIVSAAHFDTTLQNVGKVYVYCFGP